ncbi:hypothetical protein ColTof4_01353 [Colletotrichum tofieldiae]|nr:hypothetical protein ColTof3_08607 [Colletotrichum tofieldiae]GKT68930.1 hypothetical protein ColTof4_01353 [Colletotrichum tofieldiae]
MADWDQTSDGQAPGTPDTGLAKQLWAERNHGTITPRRERRLQQYTDRQRQQQRQQQGSPSTANTSPHVTADQLQWTKRGCGWLWIPTLRCGSCSTRHKRWVPGTPARLPSLHFGSKIKLSQTHLLM